MPIPPRPIPTHQRHRHQHRPGATVPRKSLPLTTPSSLEWRSEIALLNDVGPRSVPLTSKLQGSGSGPSLGMRVGGGVNLIDRAQMERDALVRERVEKEGEQWKTQISLEGLIQDGKVDKKPRDKSLGFEKVPGHTILVLPDGTSSFPATSKPKHRPSSLLSSSKDTNLTTIPAQEDKSSWPALSLSGTPSTPALVARGASASEEEEDLDDDDDWEHVPSVSASSQRTATKEGDDADDEENLQERGADEDDEDVIVLGELELEDELERLDIEERVAQIRGDKQKMKSNGKKQAKKVKGSYAAALGTA